MCVAVCGCDSINIYIEYNVYSSYTSNTCTEYVCVVCCQAYCTCIRVRMSPYDVYLTYTYMSSTYVCVRQRQQCTTCACINYCSMHEQVGT